MERKDVANALEKGGGAGPIQHTYYVYYPFPASTHGKRN